MSVIPGNPWWHQSVPAKASILGCLADVKALTDGLPSGASTQHPLSRVPESTFALALAILYKGRMVPGCM